MDILMTTPTVSHEFILLLHLLLKKINKSQIYFRIADHIYHVSDSLQFTHEPQQQSKKQKHNKG